MCKLHEKKHVRCSRPHDETPMERNTKVDLHCTLSMHIVQKPTGTDKLAAESHTIPMLLQNSPDVFRLQLLQQLTVSSHSTSWRDRSNHSQWSFKIYQSPRLEECWAFQFLVFWWVWSHVDDEDEAVYRLACDPHEFVCGFPLLPGTLLRILNSLSSCSDVDVLLHVGSVVQNYVFFPPNGWQWHSVIFFGIPSWKYRWLASVFSLSGLCKDLSRLVVHLLSFRRSVLHSTTAVFLDHLCRDGGDVPVVLVGLFWTPRRLHNCMWQSGYSEVNVKLVERCGRTSWLSTHNGSSTFLSVSSSLSKRSTNKLVFLQSGEERVSISWTLERDVCSVTTGLPVRKIVKNDGVRSRVIAFEPFLLSKFDINPIHHVLMFLPRFMHVLCKTRCSLFKGFTSLKDTVCRLLNFWPPGINPESMMECKLTALPTWWMYLKKPSRIKTSSWKINKIASWMTLESSEIHNCSWRVSTVLVSFLVSSSSCHTALPLFIKQWWHYTMILKIIFFLRIQWLHHHLEVDCHDEEDWSVSSTLHNRWSNNLVVQHRSKFFLQ